MKTVDLVKLRELKATFDKKENLLSITGKDYGTEMKITSFPYWFPVYIEGTLWDILFEEGNTQYSLHIFGLQSHEEPNDNKAEIELTITE